MITKLTLINWISHENTVLEFSRGTNLLYGDNGSGKTSILKAIIFGLFGVKPEKTVELRELIRYGQASTEITIEFTHPKTGELYYKLTRTINLQSKTNATLYEKNSSNNTFHILSRSKKEIELHIMEIFKIDKVNLYKIFYLKEGEVGQYLYSNSTFRKNLFYDILDIEKIKSIRRSTKNIENKLLDRKNTLISQNDEYESELLNDNKDKQEEAVNNLGIIQKQIDELMDKRVQLSEQSSDISTNYQLERLKNDLDNTTKELKLKNNLKSHRLRKIKEIEKIITANTIEDIDLSIQEKKNSLNELKNDLDELYTTKRELELENNTFSSNIDLLTNNTHQNICPLCLRNLNEKEKIESILAFQNKKVKNELIIKQLNSDIKEKSSQSQKLESEINILLENKIDPIEFKNIEEEINLKEKQINYINEQIANFEKKNSKLAKPSDIEIRDLNSTLNRLTNNKRELEQTLTKLNTKSSLLAGFKEKIESNNKEIKDLERKIAVLIAIEDAIDYVIKNFFSNLINLIIPLVSEKLYSRIKFGYNQIQIDTEDFIPVFTIGDRKVYFHNLSGGEKLVVYFAIRLSLLEIITKKVDFLILDDPSESLDSEHNLLLRQDFEMFFDDSSFPIKQLILATNDIRFSGPITEDFEINWDKLYYLRNDDGISSCIEITRKFEEPKEKFLFQYDYSFLNDQNINSLMNMALNRISVSKEFKSELFFNSFFENYFINYLKSKNANITRISGSNQLDTIDFIIKNNNQKYVLEMKVLVSGEENILNTYNIKALNQYIKDFNLDGLILVFYFVKQNIWRGFKAPKEKILQFENLTLDLELKPLEELI